MSVISKIGDLAKNQVDIYKAAINKYCHYADNYKLRITRQLIPFPYTDSSFSKNGITFTVNDDETITVDGTADRTTKFTIYKGSIPWNNSLCLTGCPSGGSSRSYCIVMTGYDLYGGSRTCYDGGSGGSIIESETMDEVYVYIEIYRNTTISNLVFKPMLNDGEQFREKEFYNPIPHIKTKIPHTTVADKLSKIKQNLDRVYDAAVRKYATIKSVSGSGVLSVTDSADYKPLDLKLYGKSEQKQYEGYNLVDFRNSLNKSYGITAAGDDDGIVTISGTPTTTDENIYILTFMMPVDISLLKVGIEYKTNASCQLLKNGSYTYTHTFTMSEDITEVRVYIQRNLSNYINGEKVYPVLCESKYDPNIFEPYVGGEPSPNINYPQPIVSAGQKLYEGTNFFDAKTALASQIAAGLCTVNDDGSVTLYPGWTGSTRSFTVPLKAGTYYFKEDSNCFHQLTNGDAYWQNKVVLTEDTNVDCYAIHASKTSITCYPRITREENAPLEPFTNGERTLVDDDKINSKLLTNNLLNPETYLIEGGNRTLPAPIETAGFYWLNTGIFVTNGQVLYDGYCIDGVFRTDYTHYYNIGMQSSSSGVLQTKDGTINCDRDGLLYIRLDAPQGSVIDKPYLGYVRPGEIDNLFDSEKASDASNWIDSTVVPNTKAFPIYVGAGNKASFAYKQVLTTGLGFYTYLSLTNEKRDCFIYHSSEASLINNDITFTATEDYVYLITYENQIPLFMQYIGNDLMIEIVEGNKLPKHEPYIGQSFTALTPGGLKGIPLKLSIEKGLGNYTDNSGQEFVVDYKDYENKKNVQRVIKIPLSEITGVSQHDGFVQGVISKPELFTINRQQNGLCTHAQHVGMKYGAEKGFGIQTIGQHTYIQFSGWTIEEFNSIKDVATIYTYVDVPIITDLTEDELEQYEALRMNQPNTTILNDGGAEMELDYVVKPD